MKNAITAVHTGRRLAAAGAAAVFAVLSANGASAAPVNLTSWSSTGGGTWTIAPDANSVFQSVNGSPTVFFSGENDKNKALSGTIKVETTGDNDFIGFVLGFNSGDESNADADYILIDWKQGTQGLFGCVANAGLSISQVSGPIGDNNGAWCHNPANNVTELARATTLGSTSWADNTEYAFNLTFTDNLIEVFVNGVLEISLAGSFADGSFGFYNYSQASVRYAGLQEDIIIDDPSEVPLPAAAPLMLAGLSGFAFAARKKTKRGV